MIIIKLKINIDLSVIKRNLHAAKTVCGKVYLMLKADAYGHGLEEVAQACRDIADGFAVATLEEGIRALDAGLVGKEVIVCDLAAREVPEAVNRGLTLGISNGYILDEATKISCCKDVVAQLKLDTGMRRLGFCDDELDSALEKLSHSNVMLTAVYSHLGHNAASQNRLFQKMSRRVLKYYPNAKRHLSASSFMGVDAFKYDAARIGIAAYSGAMSVYSEVISSRRANRGDFVGYSDVPLPRDTNVAAIFGGYADGIPRESVGAYVVIRQKKCEILNVCMDMTIVDTGDFIADIGEVATVVDGENMACIAKMRNTIPYTVMTGFNKGRAVRSFVD